MTHLPTPTETTGLVAQLRTTPWRDIAVRLEAAVRRERAHDSTADGYPTSTIGGGRGGGGTLIDPHRPELGTVKLTSVEAAVSSRQRSDKQTRYTVEAVDLVQRAVADIGRVIGLLDLIDEDRGVERITPAGCSWCTNAGVTTAGVSVKGDPVPWAHRTTLGNQQVFLCQPHYQYHRDHDEMPSLEQTRWYAEHGRWRIRQAG